MSHFVGSNRIDRSICEAAKKPRAHALYSTPLHSTRSRPQRTRCSRRGRGGCCPALCSFLRVQSVGEEVTPSLLLLIGEKLKGIFSKGPARRRLRAQPLRVCECWASSRSFTSAYVDHLAPAPDSGKIGNQGEESPGVVSQSAVKPVPFENQPRQRLVRSHGSHDSHRSRQVSLPKRPKRSPGLDPLRFTDDRYFGSSSTMFCITFER